MAMGLDLVENVHNGHIDLVLLLVDTLCNTLRAWHEMVGGSAGSGKRAIPFYAKRSASREGYPQEI